MASNFCAVSAKLRAMYSTCLDGDDYKNLLSKNSVYEVFGYLKNETAYSSILSDVKNIEVHRTDIEKLLDEYLYNQFVRLYTFVPSDARHMLSLWLMRYEVDYIKHKVWEVFSGEGHMRFDVTNSFFTSHTKLDVSALSKATAFSEVVEATRGSIYFDMLNTALTIGADRFSIGMMLDRLYYSIISKRAGKLPDAERKVFDKLIGTSVDLLNIAWIYRAKKYFDFKSEVIYAYIIPVHYRVNKDLIKALVESETPEQIIEKVLKTPYRGLFYESEDVFFVEENMKRIETSVAKKIFVNYSNSIASIFAYFKLKQSEIYKITMIMEAKRYGHDSKVIERHIDGLIV